MTSSADYKNSILFQMIRFDQINMHHATHAAEYFRRRMDMMQTDTQWEHFIQKGGQKYFWWSFRVFGQNNVLEGPEKPHAQNFDKIRIGKI